MVLLYVIESHYYLYLPYAMGVEHHLVLSMHALDCHFGGLVTCRHNKVCDTFGDLVSLVWSPVVKEPVVCDGSAGADTLIADLCVRGAWQPQTKALFDIKSS